MSQWFCGSAVTYRNDTKVRWLGVTEDSIRQYTEVSSQVAQEMAGGALASTPEADVSASITGHLGPGAPDGFDGLVFIGTGTRKGDAVSTVAARFQLNTSTRADRQVEAAELVISQLQTLVDSIASEP